MPQVIETIGDYTITLTDKYTFQIDGPDIENPSAYQSLALAKEKITEWRKTEAKAETRKLNLPAVDESGEPLIITGIHARSGGMLLSRKVSKYGHLYAPAPWVQATLKRIKILGAEIDTLRTTLQPTIIAHREYSVRSVDDYVERADNFAKAYETAAAAAAKGPSTPEKDEAA